MLPPCSSPGGHPGTRDASTTGHAAEKRLWREDTKWQAPEGRLGVHALLRLFRNPGRGAMKSGREQEHTLSDPVSRPPRACSRGGWRSPEHAAGKGQQCRQEENSFLRLKTDRPSAPRQGAERSEDKTTDSYDFLGKLVKFWGEERRVPNSQRVTSRLPEQHSRSCRQLCDSGAKDLESVVLCPDQLPISIEGRTKTHSEMHPSSSCLSSF